jgi:hypothetical protein
MFREGGRRWVRLTSQANGAGARVERDLGLRSSRACEGRAFVPTFCVLLHSAASRRFVRALKELFQTPPRSISR